MANTEELRKEKEELQNELKFANAKVNAEDDPDEQRKLMQERDEIQKKISKLDLKIIKMEREEQLKTKVGPSPGETQPANKEDEKEKVAEEVLPALGPEGAVAAMALEAKNKKNPRANLAATSGIHSTLVPGLLVVVFILIVSWIVSPRLVLPVAIILGTIIAFLAVKHRKAKLEAMGQTSRFYSLLYLLFILIFIFGVYFLADFYSQAFYDRPLLGQAGEFGVEVSSQFEEIRETAGVAGPLNVLTAVLLGEFDPDAQKWDSRQVRESYVVPEDFGVVFDNIVPSRNTFYYPDEIEIRGDVTVVSLFEEGEFVSRETPLEIGVEVARCERGFADILEILPGAQNTEEWCNQPWTCDIPGETKEGNKFSISKAYNRFFVCEHEGLDVKANLNLPMEVFWKYTTQAVSGRQIFVAHPDTLARIENPRTHYNIPKASLEPWSINDGTVDFGVGFDRDVEFLRAEGPKDSSDRFTRYFLGTSLENEASGEIVRINELEISIPADENIVVLDNDRNPIRKEKGQISGDFVYDRTEATADIELDVYKLRRTPLELEDDPILPGFFETFYLEMSINTDYLQNTAYQSFFVRATTSYEYRQDKGTTVRVEPEPF